MADDARDRRASWRA